jgi:hypothetical protein
VSDRADAPAGFRRIPWKLLWPPLLGIAWVVVQFRPLLSVDRVLSNRDIQLFHLPLRTCFSRLVRLGLATWNPWLHGGQPLLSNPSYAAFYPPNWITLVLPVGFALDLLAVFHGAVAFAGAWFLARRLGAGRGAAAVAAIGYSGSGAFLSLLSAFTLLCSMAWFPWVLAFGDATMRRREGWLRPALLAGAALGLQLLNGEPASVLVSGLGFVAVAIPALMQEPRRIARIALPVVVAVALAAVQLVPTASRLADSPRGQGLSAEDASLWSAPPARAIELIFPHFYGDPGRDRDGLFFGWGVNDRDYPYVISIYPGLLLSLVAIAGLCLWPIPRRPTWILAVLFGLFLALGRHNPLFEPVRGALPILAALRFPEKFLILTVAALTMAGALGWQRIIDERRRGNGAAVDLPLALAVAALGVAVALGCLMGLRPALLVGWIHQHGYPGLDASGVKRAVEAIHADVWQASATAAGAVLLLIAVRVRRIPERLIQASAVAFLAVDLWHYGHTLIRTIPASLDDSPPSLVSAIPRGSRVYIEPAPGTPDVVPAGGDRSSALDRAQIGRLEPFSGVLWHVPYALNEDFDLTLTRWASLALAVVRAEWEQEPELAKRVLGAWGVQTILYRHRPPGSDVPASDAGTHAVYPEHNPYGLPRFRFVEQVHMLPTYEEALAAARANRYRLALVEFCWRPGQPPETLSFARVPNIDHALDNGGEIRLRYRGTAPTFFVVAATYDTGWEGSVEGRRLTVLPTALGQIGIALPAGNHELLLTFRERFLPLGQAITFAALALLVIGLVSARTPRGDVGGLAVLEGQVPSA